MEISDQITERLEKLQKKYQAMGQDLLSYLDGLLHTDYLTYWEYIKLDVLLNLQNPRTGFKDESIFILYHQITELYFKLIIHAQQNVATAEDLSLTYFTEQMRRMNSYFDNLIHSFEIMIDGMEKEEFLSFRMALLPASGFQSAQYRIIEIRSADAINLVPEESREKLKDLNPVEIYEHFYWKQGATELATGTKTLTLRQFEKKYGDDFVALIQQCEKTNMWQLYKKLPESDKNDPTLLEALRNWDKKANIEWPLVHYKSAVRYLQQDPEIIAATGGTNWQKYLPPKNQHIVFFPELWTAAELKEWGT